MIENSFDPSHAPFVHEAFGGATYSPTKAIPMRSFNVSEDLRRTGFAVQHTPYRQQSPKDDDPESSITTRRFVAPCTSITTTANSEVRIYFVPQTERECRVLFSVALPLPQNALLQRLASWFLQSDLLHTWQELKASSLRFGDQDRLVMQSQDDRKMRDGRPWADLRPTPSDVGVATFQRWIRKIGGGGPFREATAFGGGSNGEWHLNGNIAGGTTPTTSMWESHGAHCAKCKRSLQRLASLQKRTAKAAKTTLSLSGLLAAAVSLVAKKLLRDSASCLWARPALVSSLLLFLASYALGRIETWAGNVQGKMLQSDSPQRQIPLVYHY